jgi:hypothetical protein
MVIIHTHSYHIPLCNVLHYGRTKFDTLGFRLVDGSKIITTCPFQKGATQIDDGLRYKSDKHQQIYLTYKSVDILKRRLGDRNHADKIIN